MTTTRVEEYFASNSRVARAIEQVERGEDVDANRILALQPLDQARIGELFMLDAMEADRAADDAIASLLDLE